MLLLESSFSLFFGRFHPVMVHLPIGFLLMAALMEFFGPKGRNVKLDAAIQFTLLVGALSAFVAAGMGWFLAEQGGYNESHLFWHRWLGIGVGVVGLVAWFLKKGSSSAPNPVYKFSLIALVGMLVWTGHLGGNMTHGATYLTEYAPAPIAALLGHSSKKNTKRVFNNPDSVFVYQDIIQPFLEKRCFECHNEDKANGGLQMHTQELLAKGGDGGPVLAAGKAIDSELFKRITKDPTSKKFMPTGGKMHLGFEEVKLIGWWIENGASFTATIAESEMPKDIKHILENSLGVSLIKKSYVEIASVAPAALETITEIKTIGFNASPLANGNNFLDVRYNKLGATPSKVDLEKLLPVKEQITWLNLANMKITDDLLTVIAQFPNLTRLQIQQNPITDNGIASLTQLEHLESLNLYGTPITDAALPTFEKLPNLKKLFLWQTQVSVEGAESLREKMPKLVVDLGFSVEKKS